MAAKLKLAPNLTDDELAMPMVFSVYPCERAELFRIQQELGLRTPFDVIRKVLLDAKLPKKGAIHEPAKKRT